MLNSILVPIDFSDVSINALNYGINLAQKCGAQLHLLHIKQTPISDPNYPLNAFTDLMYELEKNEKENFEKIENTTLKHAGLSYHFKSASGFVADEVCNYSQLNQMDLVVMGTKGASGFSELLIGSNTAAVVAQTQIPVLVVPPICSFKPITHLLYASDFNEPEFPAVLRLKFFAELFNSKISVLHAKNDFDDYFNAENNFFTRNGAKISNQMELFKVEGNDVLSIINHFVEDKAVDFLVMAKHNRSFFDKLFHQSLTKQMAYHTKIPLLVLNK